MTMRQRPLQMKSILLLAACAAALTGCAGIETTVRARSAPDFGAGERTYAFADNPAAAAGGDDAAYTPAVARRLAQLGYVAAPAATARYRVALSHDTRPASVSVAYTRCAGGPPCGTAEPPRAPGFPWPGLKTYVHSLTLRFFDRADGREAYEVSVAKRDRERNGQGVVDDLVAAALARAPFESGRHTAQGDGASGNDPTAWKVRLRENGPDAPPSVTRIVPLP
jgi:hypothetical protein